MPSNPLSVTGYATDPVSQLPDFVMRQQKKKAQEERYGKLLNEGNEIVNELAGEQGMIVREAIALLEQRINVLIAEDPECQAYDKMFRAIKFKVDAARKIAQSKAPFI